jgi:thioredoxin 1
MFEPLFLLKYTLTYMWLLYIDQEITSKMEIKAIPTFLLLSGGTPVDKIVGANPDEIRKRVDNFIQSTPS